MASLAKRAAFDPASKDRRLLIAKIHVAKKEMALSDDDYRAMLFRVTGQMSAADCGLKSLHAMMDEMKSKGFKPKKAQRAADHPASGKARAMWISLHQLGAIANPSERALEAFARRQLGVARLQWADQSQTYKLIEALKAIAERHGWNQDLGGVRTSGTVKVLKLRLCEAILRKLQAAGLAADDWTLQQAACRLLGMKRDSSATFWPIGEIDLLASGLGAKLRGERP